MKKQTLLLLLFILLKFVLQYNLISPEYDLHRDEYLHLDQAKHLAWGYLSVPPFTSWISYIILLLGNGVFWVKFFPALFGALTLILVWKIIRELQGGIFACILGATAIIFSSFMRLNMLYQPNSADIFFWTLLYFTLIRYFNYGHTKWLWYAATAFAFGFLNKYNILFLAAALLAAMLVTPQRKIFSEKKLYFSAILSLVIVLPNLLWQYQNGFPVVLHMNELAKTQLENVNRMDFVKEQILFFLGAVYVVVGGLLALAFSKPFKKYRFVFWSYVFTMALFIFLKAKGYYAVGLYPVLIAFGAVYWEAILSNGWKRFFRPVVVGIPILLFFPIVKVAFPVYPPQEIAQNTLRYKKLGLLRWEDGKDHQLPQDFAHMLGWKELAKKVDNAYAFLPNKEQTIILCDNYGQAGAINYYTRFRTLHAVSFNADYINWIPLDKPIINAILVKELEDDDPERNREQPLFESVEKAGQIENRFARETGTAIYVLKSAKADINARIREEIALKKSNNGN